MGWPNDWEWTSAFVLGGERVHLRLDGLSALFLVLVSIVGGAGAAYARFANTVRKNCTRKAADKSEERTSHGHILRSLFGLNY